MADWKSKLEKYVTFGEKDQWCCKLCKIEKNGHRSRVIAHLTRNPGKGIKVCPKITSEQVEELKRELGLGPDLTGADGQQPQQPGENDDIRQENGNKKRKGASGSGTSGSNQREAEMSLLVSSSPSIPPNMIFPFSDGNGWGLNVWGQLSRELKILSHQFGCVEEIEKEIWGETEQGDEMLLRKRNNDTKRWVGYAASFKSDVHDLNVEAGKATSFEEILQLLSRANELKKIGDVVIATGLSLLHPVPKDISSWNPTYMSCGSQFVNQMPLGQFPPQV